MYRRFGAFKIIKCSFTYFRRNMTELSTIATLNANISVDKETIQNAFISHNIVPKITESPPTDFLTVEYVTTDKKVNLGQELAPKDVSDPPNVKYEADEADIYTLVMIDPDAPSKSLSFLGEILHWLIVNIPASRVEDGQIIAEYIKSGPPKYSGLHRYIFLLYKQPRAINFVEPKSDKDDRRHRIRFSAKKFAEKYKLGPPVAGNFFTAQYDESVASMMSRFTGCFRRTPNN